MGGGLLIVGMRRKMENLGLTSGIQSFPDEDMSSPADGNTIPEVLDWTAHALQLFQGSGQHDPHLQSMFLPQPGGVSNTSSNDTDARAGERQLKRETDLRYRQIQRERREKDRGEIQQLSEENAILQAGSGAAELDQRYEESKRENALLKKQLKKEKRQKKAIEKALLERIMNLESTEKQDIEPSSSYPRSELSTM